MSRVTAPLLSFGASGQIAKTQVYSSWKGRPYVRRYAIPSNPNTAEQQLTRSVFSWLNNVWKYFPAGAVDAWQAYGANSRFTDRNGFIKKNLANLRTAADLNNFVFSPSAGGGIAAASITVTPGVTQLTVAAGEPSLPTGWTINKAIMAIIRQQDPNTGVLYAVESDEDATAPYSVVFTGLVTGQVYIAGTWFEFTKPDGSFAYGQSLQDDGTPT